MLQRHCIWLKGHVVQLPHYGISPSFSFSYTPSPPLSSYSLSPLSPAPLSPAPLSLALPLSGTPELDAALQPAAICPSAQRSALTREEEPRAGENAFTPDQLLSDCTASPVIAWFLLNNINYWNTEIKWNIWPVRAERSDTVLISWSPEISVLAWLKTWCIYHILVIRIVFCNDKEIWNKK